MCATFKTVLIIPTTENGVGGGGGTLYLGVFQFFLFFLRYHK